MNITKNKLLPTLACVIAGGISIVSFAPLGWPLFAFIAVIILLQIWKTATAKQASWYGFLFGIGQFGFGTSWIYISIHQFGNSNWFLAGAITALFIVFMSLYPALQGYLFVKLFGRKPLYVKCLLAFPALWVCIEWLRSWLFTGFPWLLLGYSQVNTVLNGYAPLFSVYAISLIVTLISGAIVLIISRSSAAQKIIAGIIMLLLITLAIPFHYHNWTHTHGKSLSVALVQGNVLQSLKWNPNQVWNIMQKYFNATKPYLNHSLVVWPEAAVPILANQAQEFTQLLNQLAKQQHSAIIFGIPIAKQTKVYNALMTVGDGHGIYAKRHLVPFGEYTPLGFIFDPIMQYFNIPMSDLSKGPAQQSMLDALHTKIAAFICYEIGYPFEVSRYSAGSQLIITASDDSWFGNSIALSQQLEMAQMRAIETGRFILYVSNTGITALINPMGNIISRLPENRLAVLTGQVYPMQGNTPLMRYSYYPLLAILIVLLLTAMIIPRRRNPQGM